MIKKWSYVVAAAATVFGGSILTGCIDNDEPLGIQNIRVETANLLKAKQALVEADAALKQAQADLDRTALEIEKIKLENEKAQAAAQAELAKLEAEARIARENAKNEADIAWIEAQIADMKARTEADMQEKAEKLRVAIERQEIINKNLQLKYDKLAYEWEQAKLKYALDASTELWKALDYAYNQYLYMLAAYNTLADNLTTLQRAEAQWLNNLYYDDASKTWKHPQDEYKDLIQKDIDDANNTIATETAAKARYEAEIEEFTTFQNNPDGIYAKWQSLKQELVDNAAAKANNEIKQAELKTTPAYKQAEKDVETAQAAADNYKNNNKIAIPAYTFEANPALGAIGIETTELVKPNTTYTLAKQANYDAAVDAYETLMDQLDEYLIDGENAQQWTLARVEELKRQISPLQKAYEAADAMWVNAKAVYANGGTVDANALAGEEALVAAINAYNAFEGKYEALAGKFKTANEEADAADEAYGKVSEKAANEAWKAAQETYDKAIAKADTDYNKAVAAAETAYNKIEADGNNAVAQAQRELETAQKLVNDLDEKFKNDKTNATYKAEKKAAEAKVDAKETALKTAKDTAKADLETAETTQANAIVTANVAWAKARDNARIALDTAHKTWVAAGADKPEVAEAAALAEAKDAAVQSLKDNDLKTLTADYKKAVEDLQKAYKTQFDKVKGTITNWVEGTTNIPAIVATSEAYATAVEAGNKPDFVKAMEAPITYMADGVYVNAKWYLIAASEGVYGDLFPSVTSSITGPTIKQITDINFDPAAIIATVDTEVLNQKVRDEQNDQTLPAWKCVKFYGKFGAYGKLAAAENAIKVAEAMVQNSKLYDETMSTLNTNLAAVEKTLTDANAEYKKLTDAVTAKQTALAALSTDLTTEFNNLDSERKTLENIVKAIEDNFFYLNDLELNGKPIFTPQGLEQAIKTLNTSIATAQSKIDSATAELKEAEANLALLENGNAEYTFNPFTTRIKNTQAELSLAEEKLAAYKARLDEVQAKYEAAAKQ